MYSWEIQRFINDRHGILQKDDVLKIIDIETNPQLKTIHYDNYQNKYELWDDTGQYFSFSVKLNDDYER